MVADMVLVQKELRVEEELHLDPAGNRRWTKTWVCLEHRWDPKAHSHSDVLLQQDHLIVPLPVSLWGPITFELPRKCFLKLDLFSSECFACVSVYICTTCVQCLWKPGEGLRTPGTGVSGVLGGRKSSGLPSFLSGSSLQVFYWFYLHLCSSVRLIYSFVFSCVSIWFHGWYYAPFIKEIQTLRGIIQGDIYFLK